LKLHADQLDTHLTKSLLPVYLVSGQEPLLIQETLSKLIKVAKAQDFSEHCIYHVETQFDWEKFLLDAFTRSLFSAKGIIELRFGEQAINAAATKALQTYFERQLTHKILLIVVQKLEASTQKSAWFKCLEQVGASVQIWPVEKTQLPAWLAARARQNGLMLNSQAISTLAELVEGNLLAADQAIDRLSSMANHETISAEKILQTISDQARFTIFDLLDALLAKDLKRTYRIFYCLKEEGIEPLFLLNLITKDLRLLARLNHAVSKGASLEQTIKNLYLPAKKQALLRRILPHYSIPICRSLIQKAMLVDQVLKGAQKGDKWQALSEFFFCFCYSS
jgi:DNA polymerase-3 subunit delta